jgi:hypothetical protein
MKPTSSQGVIGLIIRRKAGEALHPEREPVALLKNMRRMIGEYNFAGQYQELPSPLGGGMVKAEWFRHYIPGRQPAKFDMIIQSWDTANKCTELSDYSVCITRGARKNGFTSWTCFLSAWTTHS